MDTFGTRQINTMAGDVASSITNHIPHGSLTMTRACKGSSLHDKKGTSYLPFPTTSNNVPHQPTINSPHQKPIMPEPSRYLALYEQQYLTDPSNNCYVCAQIRQRKPDLKQTSLSNTCLLCNNPFCDAHKSKRDNGVCEINHGKSCSDKRHVDRHAPTAIFVSLEARRMFLAAGQD